MASSNLQGQKAQGFQNVNGDILTFLIFTLGETLFV